MEELTPYIFILIGVVFFVVAMLVSARKNGALQEEGEKVEGTIFDIEGNQGESGVLRPVIQVRFMTKENEWITAPIDQEFQVTFLNQYQQGEKVEVFYNKSNPRDFFVPSKQNPIIARYFFLVIALLMVGYGIFNLIV